MRIKRFEAKNMTRALELIKEEFGPEAVILSARTIKRESGIFKIGREGGVEVTAAIDDKWVEKKSAHSKNEKKGRFRKREENFQKGERDGGTKSDYWKGEGKAKRPFKMKEEERDSKEKTPEKWKQVIYSRLLSQGVNKNTAMLVVQSLNRFAPKGGFSSAEELKRGITRVLERMGAGSRRLGREKGKNRFMTFLGPTGAGKTTTIAKLATMESLHGQRRIGLITTDDYRIGAAEKLRVYGEILGVPVLKAGNSAKLKESLKKFRDKDIVLIDTPGIHQRDRGEIQRVLKVFDKRHPIKCHLVLNATTKDGDLEFIMKNFKMVSIESLVFTRIDETTTVGNILNQMINTKIPISYISKGEEVPEALSAASVETIVDLLVGEVLEEHGVFMKPEEGDYTGREAPKAYYLANRESDVFHRADCRWAKKIKKQNLVVIDDINVALKNGLYPCKLCNPGRVQPSSSLILRAYRREGAFAGK